MKTPICPNCRAKFSHNNSRLECNTCGIPDEIARMGPQTIRRWNKDRLRQQGFSRRHAKDTAKRVGARKSRSRNKHGRKGVKNV